MAEINITPFTDVVLVLLVICMITTPLILQSSIKVSLPRATSARPADNTDQISVTVTDKGRIYLDDAPVTIKEFKDKIRTAYQGNRDIKIILFSDNLARFKDIVAVIDTLKEIGVRNLNIAAKTGK